MRCVFLAFLAAGITMSLGCTTPQPIEATADEIQRMIRSEGVLEPGQRVRLVTSDEQAHEFRIADIDLIEGVVSSADEAVRIDDIVALETRKLSVGRTALLTGGLVYGVGVIIAIAIAPAILLGGG